MSQATKAAIAQAKDVHIRSGDMQLEGDLSIPDRAQGVVLFAHGSGSSRHSPRNQFVARTIREAGVGTLLFDLLTKEEEAVDMHTAHLRFDIGLLATRLIDASYWIIRGLEALGVTFGKVITGMSPQGGRFNWGIKPLGVQMDRQSYWSGLADWIASARASAPHKRALVVGLSAPQGAVCIF